MENLISEGDINHGRFREKWNSWVRETQSGSALTDDSNCFLHQSLSTPCLDVLDHAEGTRLYAKSGIAYMDFHGNNVHHLGHKNEYILNRIKAQMDILPFSPRRFTNEPAIHCAKQLSALMPDRFNRVLFAPAGTLAIGMALKLARVVTGKHKVVSLWDSFHGASLDAISVGGEAQFRAGMGALLPGVERIPPPMTYRNMFSTNDDLVYADYLEYVIRKEGEIGAFVIETLRNTDVQIPSKQYWKRVREICDQYGVLLILDEIPIAFGRSGKMFVFEHFDIEPDILCLGKGMGGGVFPMAGIITRDRYNVAGDISLGHYTHEKSPLGCVATTAVLDYIREYSILEKVQEDALFYEQQLIELKSRYGFIGDIRGIGLLWGIELVKDRNTKTPDNERAEFVLYECLRRGLSFKVSQGNVIQLSPPLTISRDDLQLSINILNEAFAASS